MLVSILLPATARTPVLVIPVDGLVTEHYHLLLPEYVFLLLLLLKLQTVLLAMLRLEISVLALPLALVALA